MRALTNLLRSNRDSPRIASTATPRSRLHTDPIHGRCGARFRSLAELSGRESGLRLINALGGRDGLRQAPAAIRISRRLVGLLELALVIGAPLLRSRLAGLFGLKARLDRPWAWFRGDQSPAQ